MSALIPKLPEHHALWRGDACASETAVVPSGFGELDALLPGHGWPQAALTEILIECEGIGELRLMLPALRELLRERRRVVWIAPPYLPYIPALVAAGVDPRGFVIVNTTHAGDSLWAYEQALRSRDCGAVFAWLSTRDDRILRRLQLAAREGNTWGVLWRRPGELPSPSPVALRLALSPHHGQLKVRILKRRGADVMQPLFIDVSHTELTSSVPSVLSVALASLAAEKPLRPFLPATH